MLTISLFVILGFLLSFKFGEGYIEWFRRSVGLVVGAAVGYVFCIGMYAVVPKSATYSETEITNLASLPGTDNKCFLVVCKTDSPDNMKLLFKPQGKNVQLTEFFKTSVRLSEEERSNCYTAWVIKKEKSSYSWLWIPPYINNDLSFEYRVMHVPKRMIAYE